MSDKKGMELVCHGVTEVNLITALGFCSMTSSIESLQRLERAHELVTSLGVEVLPGALQTEQKIGGWREALENEMNFKDSEANPRPTGSRYLVGSSSAPYCNSKYPTHMVSTPEQLSNVNMNRNLDLFSTTCKILRTPKAIERIWSRQRLMPWFRAVMKSWMYERAKRHMSRNTEAYQSFQLDIGPGAYKRAFLTHRNAVITAVKRIAGAPSVTETEKREVLRADLERNVSLCLHNSFCRNREQKVYVDLLPCCEPRLLDQESWGTARNSMDMLQKVLEDSETEDQDGEAME